MSRFPARLYAVRLCLFVIGLLQFNLLNAGDEDMLNPYTQFDPETGYFLPIEQMPPQQSPADSTAATEAVPETVPEASADPALAADPDVMSVPAPGTGPAVTEEPAFTAAGQADNQAILLVPLVLILLAGLFVGFRMYRRNAS